MVNIDGKQDGYITVHPLDTCCMDIIERFVQLSKLDVVMELLAQSSGTYRSVDEAWSMFQLIVVGKSRSKYLKIIIIIYVILK